MTKLTRDDFERLVRIVREETGNDVQDKNHSMLESRMSSYLLKLGIDSMASYWRHFETHEADERRILQGLMTTHYTFFFREYAHFEAVGDWIKENSRRLVERHKSEGRPVRIWSAACSRGQEVYSLAMFLEENLSKPLGVPYEIVGTDIDEKSVSYARNGVYPIKEVNTIPHHYLAYWKKGTGSIKDFAAAHPSIRAKTRFEVLNLLETRNWAEKKTFDIVFCRNVFIYFSEENVRKIALDLARRLDPAGLFVSGLSEPLRFEGWNMTGRSPSVYQPAGISAPVERPPVAVASAGAKYRVLCVDDSTTIQALIRKIYGSDPNCEGVDVAGHGGEARRMLDRSKYDIITLDIHMPEVGGIEFLETLYRKESDPPVLMISSVNRTDQDLALRALSLGAVDYVEKPAMNTLKKSADEILAKTKLALRPRSKALPEVGPGQFDESIARKVIVPDASQCVRIVFADSASISDVGRVLNGQKSEIRSPAFVAVFREVTPALEKTIAGLTKLPVQVLAGTAATIRPNHVYLVSGEKWPDFVSTLRSPSRSVQILSLWAASFPGLSGAKETQMLVAERLQDKTAEIRRAFGIVVSDITPPTSFASLSFEFFAKLRKAA